MAESVSKGKGRIFVPVQRKKKKQVKKTKRMIPVFAAVILLLFCGIALLKEKPKEASKAAQHPVAPHSSLSKSVEETAAQTAPETTAETNIQPKKNTPKVLLDLVKKNPETAEFVNAWPGSVPEKVDISEDYTEGNIPHFLQWDLRWGYQFYGGEWPEDYMGLAGCGPTALSMVVVGMTGDLSADPGSVAVFAEKSGYATPDNGTMWALISEGSRNYGLEAEEVALCEEDMSEALKQSPMICVVGPGDFTQSGHFMVITGYQNGRFQILDPNSKANSEKTWDYETLAKQILAMWKFSVI